MHWSVQGRNCQYEQIQDVDENRRKEKEEEERMMDHKEMDRQSIRMGDDSEEMRHGLVIGGVEGMRLVKKYGTKTKSLVVRGTKETEVKLEQNNQSSVIGEARREYRYPEKEVDLKNNIDVINEKREVMGEAKEGDQEDDQMRKN